MAQDNLSIMYYEGLGVKQDLIKAHILWKLGSVNSDVNLLKNSPEYFSKDREDIKNNVSKKKPKYGYRKIS